MSILRDRSSDRADEKSILTDKNYEKVIERFGFSAKPEPTLDNLNRLYKAWCRGVGYDNILKRVYYAAGDTGPFPVMNPNDFVSTWIKHGTSGSCWPTAEALFNILLKTGYDVERVSCEMLNCGDPMRPNHGTCFVHIDGSVYVVDTGVVSEEVLQLVEGQDTKTSSKAFGIWSKGDGHVWWRPSHSTQNIEIAMIDRDCGYEYFAHRYEKTKEFSLFNHSLYVRKNKDDGIITYGRGNVIRVDPAGEMSVTPIDPEGVPALLIEEMGLSEEIVSKTPIQDEEGAKFDP